MVVAAKLVGVLAAAASIFSAVPYARGDFLNEYLNDKTFGDQPGPCPDLANACSGDFENLPPSVKAITVRILGIPITLGEFIKSGEGEIWDLQCKRISVRDIDFTREETSSTTVRESIKLEELRLACSFRVNLRDLTLDLAQNGLLQVRAALSNTPLRFPRNFASDTGSLDTTLQLILKSAPGEIFDEELPWQVELPVDECEISTSLGIFLQLSDFDTLELRSSLLLNRWIDITGGTNALLGLIPQAAIDTILYVIVLVIEAFVGGVVCQFIDELALLGEAPNETDGVLNVFLKEAKDVIDELASVAPIDPRPNDSDAAILNSGLVSQTELDEALNFADSTIMESVSVGINQWLGSTSRTPGYENSLVINEVVDTLTNPVGYAEINLLEEGLAPEVELELNVTKLDARLDKVAVGGLNSFKALSLLNNGGDSQGNNKLRYTLLNNVELQEVEAQVRVALELAPGGWVTAGTATTRYEFTFGLTLSELLVDAAVLALFNFEKIEEVKVGQLTGLTVNTDDSLDEIQNYLADALQCVAPAFAALNFTDLELAGTFGDVVLRDFSGPGLGDLVQDSAKLAGDVLRGALTNKLRGLSRSIIRETINDLIVEYVTSKRSLGIVSCPAAPAPTNNGPERLNFESGIFGNIAELIEGSVGGNPIIDSGADINEPIDIILSYFADSVTEFPLQKRNVNPDQGQWELASAYKDSFKLPAYQRPTDFLAITGFQLNNVNSIYKLLAYPDSFGSGLSLEFGLGGELGPNPETKPQTPLKIKLPLRARIDGTLDAQFSFELVLSDIDFLVNIREIYLDLDRANQLSLRQLFVVPCALSPLHAIYFNFLRQSLSVRNIDVLFEQNTAGPADNKLVVGLNAVSAEISGSGFPEDGGVFESLVNTILENGLFLALQAIQELPANYNNLTADTCESALDPLQAAFELAGSELPDIPALIEECTEPVDFSAAENEFPFFEAKVDYNENTDSYIDLLGNPIVQFATGVLDAVFVGGGLNTTLVELATSTSDSFLSAIFELDPQDPTKVNLALPLSSLGLFLENSDLVPGLRIDAGTFKLLNVNNVLRTLSLIKPIGRFTTRSIIKFEDENGNDVPVEARLEAYVEADNAALGLPGAGKTREEIDITFNLLGFRSELDVVTAFDINRFAEKTFGNFLRVDEQQTIFLTDTFLECFGDLFFPNGLAIAKLDVRVNELTNVAVTSRNNNLLSNGFELLTAGVIDLVIDFYKAAITPISQNCIRPVVNDFLGGLQGAGLCPLASQIPPVPLNGADQLFRFNTSADWAALQSLSQNFLVADNYETLNTALEATINGAKFLEAALGDEFLIGGPVVYAEQFYGTILLGASDVILSGLGFSDLRLMQPVELDNYLVERRVLADYTDGVTPEQVGYTTLTNIDTIPSQTVGIQADIRFDADDLFEDIPKMKNRVRLKLNIKDFHLDLLLRLQVNITALLTLPFDVATAVESLPCILIPIQDVAPLSTNFTLGSVGLEATCIGQCDLPFFDSLGTLTFESDNGEVIASLINTAFMFTADYLFSVNAQDVLTASISSVASTCGQLLDILDLLATPPKPPDVASTFGYMLFGLSALTIMGAGLMYPVHKIRRKEVLLANVVQQENELQMMSMEAEEKALNRIVNVTELRIKPLFQNPAVPKVAKFGFPFCAVAVIIIVVIACVVAPLLDFVLKVTLLGADTVYWAIVPLTIPNMINTLWTELNPIIGLAVGLVCGLVPVVQAFALLIIWFAPNTVLNANKRAWILWTLQATGKIGFVFLFIIANLQAAMFTVFSAADYRNTAFLSENTLATEINLRPLPGVMLVAFNACFVMVLSHIGQFYFDKTNNFNKKQFDLVEGVRRSTSATPSKATTARVRVIDHVFSGRDSAGKARRVDTNKGTLLAAASAFGALLIVIGVFVTIVEFEIVGALGIVLREITLDSPTIEQPLNFKPFSLVEFGLSFSEAPYDSGAAKLGIIFMQLLFFAVFILIPIMQPIFMAAILLGRYKLPDVRRFIKVETIFMFWNAIDLAVIVTIATPLLLPNLIEVYINFISEQALGVDNFCFDLEVILAELVPEERDSKCMSVLGHIQPAFIFLVLGLLVQSSCNFIFVFLAKSAVTDRYFVAYGDRRSDAKPLRVGRIGRLVLTQMTAAFESNSPSPASNTMWDSPPDEIESVGCCKALFMNVKGTSDEALVASTKNRVTMFQQKYGGANSANFSISPHMPGTRVSDNPVYQSSFAGSGRSKSKGPAGSVAPSRPSNPARPGRQAPTSFVLNLTRSDSVEV